MKDTAVMKRIIRAVWIILASLFVFSAIQYGKLAMESKKADSLYTELASEMHAGEAKVSTPLPSGNDSSLTEEELEAERLAAEAARVEALKEGAGSLAAKNSDFICWLTIPGTGIDYPVMHTPNDPEFYLHRDFGKNYSGHGTPFLDYKCTTDSDNLLLYGHHMRDGSMFAGLTKFADLSYLAEHNRVQLITADTVKNYEIFCVFKLGEASFGDFTFFEMPEFETEADFEKYLDGCGRYAVQMANFRPEYGTQLVSLTTCEYSHQNGRMVVVAAEIPE